MEKQTVFIRVNLPELPDASGGYICNLNNGHSARINYSLKSGFYSSMYETANITSWLREIELPTQEEIAKLEQTISSLLKEKEENRWISVEERLPELDKPVLVYNNFKGEDIYKRLVLCYDGSEWREFYSDNYGDENPDELYAEGFYPDITHWRELPVFPTEGEAKNG